MAESRAFLSKRSKHFFLKKEAKTFATGAARGWCKIRRAERAGAKVFWLFVSKKHAFLP
jgi:hypothetical protein